MPSELRFLDHATRDDLRIFLERLQHVGQPEVRVIVRDSQLAVFGCTQAPASLLDPVPVVIVQRSFALGASPDTELDETVMGRALLDRIARLGVIGLQLELPETSATAAWAGVLPPVGGWQAAGAIDAGSLATVAEQGAARVAEMLPDSPGDAVIRKIRASVWGLEMVPGIPAAAAFAADAMGFLRGEESVGVARTLTWTRLYTSKGQVVVRGLLG